MSALGFRLFSHCTVFAVKKRIFELSHTHQLKQQREVTPRNPRNGLFEMRNKRFIKSSNQEETNQQVGIMIPLSQEQLVVFLIISIWRVFDLEQVINSFAGSTIVEVGKSILSKLKKPLPTLSREELESLLIEYGDELKKSNLQLACKIDENRTDIVTYLETTIKKGNEAIISEIKNNSTIEHEIMEVLKRLEETILHEKRIEQLNRLWTDRPRKVVGYVSRKKEEEQIRRELEGNYNVICVEGLPGSGKTYLLSRIYEEEDPERTFWCQIEEGHTFDDILEAFARFFSSHVIENIKKGLLSPQRNYKDICDDLKRNFTSHRYLFFFDNYHLLKDEQADAFFKSLLELDLKSKVILATREILFSPSLSHSIGRVSLHGFEQEEVQEFLQQNGIVFENECFHTLCKKTEKIPILILLTVQKLKEIPEDLYCDFIESLPNKDIEDYLIETVHEGLNTEEQTMLQILSALHVPESVRRISRLSVSIDAESTLDRLEKSFLIKRNIFDEYSSHEIFRDFYEAFMEKRSPHFLCEINLKVYEMYHEDFEQGDVEAGSLAIDHAEKVLNFCDRKIASALDSYVPILYNRVANEFLRIYKPITAIRILNTALEDNRKRGNLSSEAYNLNTLSSAYLAMNETSNAIKFAEKALKIDEEVGDRRQQAIDMNLLGKAWLESNESKKAVDYLEEALKIHQEVGDRRQQAIDMNLLGKAWLESNEPKKAVDYLEEALKIDEEVGDRRQQAIDMNLLGKAWLESDEPRKAVDYLEKALKIDEEVGDRRQQAIDMNLLGKAWLESNEPKKAVDYLEEALKIDEEVGDRRSQAIDMNLLGKVLEELDRNSEAIQYYETALQISREIRNIRNVCYNLYALGNIYFKLENYARAELYFKEFVAIPSKKNAVPWMNAFERLGDIYNFKNDTGKALEYYKKALALCKRKPNRLEKKIYELEIEKERK